MHRGSITKKFKATAASSLCANTQAKLNNNNFNLEWIAPQLTAISTSSKAVSTSLSIAPGPQVASRSHHFHQTWVLTAQAT